MSYFEFKKKIKNLNLNPNVIALPTPKGTKLVSGEISAPQRIENLAAIFKKKKKKKKKAVALVKPLLTYLCANYISLVVTFFQLVDLLFTCNGLGWFLYSIEFIIKSFYLVSRVHTCKMERLLSL